LLIFVEFFTHFHEFLGSNFSSICQESSSSEDAFLSMCRVELFHEQITWKFFADTAMLDPACCTSVQFALTPKRLPILLAASRTTRFLLPFQEYTCSTVSSTRCNTLRVHPFHLSICTLILLLLAWIKLPLRDAHALVREKHITFIEAFWF